ncbi:Pre-mRNA-splicing factor Cwf15/Cwc15 [Boletus edulis]|uniref:Pre-mRNA-splicing factor Cwf15/Cwc15 n=1 Tax=Boletus edulis BED1 TaxID=1328754 RepID=A0AAD4C894_BOLED|nr:Pre-mRNA-splicing factor Cwf15/Cwc15 [Boletus edulis]KAF8131071.1 Pre-mRNA-splicing factor Cwf15/Cwc15 [Boletus edulis]KAF8451083.1 Pre-mRNA-splicing factor Cwf15/Cwc15 [Boletus edulis BED1]
MSTAHRPTWDPAQAREVKGGSRQFSVRDMAAHTKLKFRQPGQTSVGEVARRDLRVELLAAEQEARNKKRKAEGKPPLGITAGTNGTEDEDAIKRRKLLQEALELDKDDDEDEDRDEEGQKDKEEEESEEESEEEDDTDELLRELEKIKRERAEEKARQEREQMATQAEELGQLQGLNTTVPGTFSVKKRWDDDLIFKNQTMNQKEKSGQFVNDLLRTEFHKKFMAKFIKLAVRQMHFRPSLVQAPAA